MREKPDPLEPHDTRRSAPHRSLLRDAKTFELSAKTALGGNGNFFEWLLLETLYELIEETKDAVSQAQVVARTGLPKTVVSYWLSSMDDRGVVDRAPALDGRAYRIFLSSDGKNTLHWYSQQLAAAGLIERRGGELLESLA